MIQGSYPSLSLQLISYEDGSLKDIIAETKYGTDIKLSPNMKYIAFQEFRQIYIAPFIKTPGVGMSITARPGLASNGVIQISDNGGNFISWTNDATLHWALGPELFTVDVSGLFV